MKYVIFMKRSERGSETKVRQFKILKCGVKYIHNGLSDILLFAIYSVGDNIRRKLISSIHPSASIIPLSALGAEAALQSGGKVRLTPKDN